MQLTDWLLIKVSLLLIGLTKISLTKSGFDHPSIIESPLRLRALKDWGGGGGRCRRQQIAWSSSVLLFYGCGPHATRISQATYLNKLRICTKSVVKSAVLKMTRTLHSETSYTHRHLLPYVHGYVQYSTVNTFTQRRMSK